MGAIKMNTKIVTTAYAIGKIGRVIAVVLSFSILIHVIVMAIDLFTVKEPLYLDLHGDFIGGVFSFPMIPMIVAYCLLITGTYTLWLKMKKTLLHINEIEMKYIGDQAVIKALQRTSELLAKHIIVNNTAIFQWIQSKKEKGHQVPYVVEQSCTNISLAIQALNKASYIVPYNSGDLNESLLDLERELENELNSLMRIKENSQTVL
jgi:hypothetical protein